MSQFENLVLDSETFRDLMIIVVPLVATIIGSLTGCGLASLF